MSKLDVVRAWKDEEYRESLSAADRSQLPQNPAGIIELTDQDMNGVEGGTISLDPWMCGSFITVCSYDPLWCPVTITILPASPEAQ